MKIVYKDLEFCSEHNNLAQLDPKLQSLVGDKECFYVSDLTDTIRGIVAQSGVQEGLCTAQVMHTTCVLSLNEFDEPMLLGDFGKHLEKEIPKAASYFHNSSHRTANLCEEDNKCDRNADAHIKAFLVGTQALSIIIREGQLALGRWQRLALVDFDGPKHRKIVVQIIGE